MVPLRIAVFLIWICAILMALVKTNRSANFLFRLQALGEAGVAAILAVTMPYGWLWLSVAAIVIIKIAIVPSVLFRHDALVQNDYGARSPFGMSALLGFFLAVTVLGLAMGRWLTLGESTLVGVLMASLFVSLIHMSSRYEVWSISRALLSLETIVGAGVLIVGASLKEPADFAIDLVALFLALTIARVASTIMRLKNTVDVRDIKELIG